MEDEELNQIKHLYRLHILPSFSEKENKQTDKTGTAFPIAEKSRINRIKKEAFSGGLALFEFLLQGYSNDPERRVSGGCRSRRGQFFQIFFSGGINSLLFEGKSTFSFLRGRHFSGNLYPFRFSSVPPLRVFRSAAFHPSSFYSY